MVKKKFTKEQLLKSKSFPYSKDLIECVLKDEEYTKAEAEKEIQKYFSLKV